MLKRLNKIVLNHQIKQLNKTNKFKLFAFKNSKFVNLKEFKFTSIINLLNLIIFKNKKNSMRIKQTSKYNKLKHKIKT